MNETFLQRHAGKLILLALLAGTAIAAARPVIDAAYDFAKMRRSFYNDPRIGPDGLRVIDAMATEWLNNKRAEQQSAVAKGVKK